MNNDKLNNKPTNCFDCTLLRNCLKFRKIVRIKFKKPQFYFMGNHKIEVFSENEEVLGTAVIYEKDVYCSIGFSNKYNYAGCIDLDNVEIIELKE